MSEEALGCLHDQPHMSDRASLVDMRISLGFGGVVAGCSGIGGSAGE